MRLLLIRHGQTSSNVGHHLDTAVPGADLTDFGRRQAAAIPGALADEAIGAVFVSTLVRTHQTAAPLLDRLRLLPHVDARIREISAGDLEMRNDKAAIDRYVETVFGWEADLDRPVPGGQSGREVVARFDAATRSAARLGAETVAFVSHGAIIRVWTALRADNVDMGYAATHWLPNTAMVVVEGHPDRGWTMDSWGECALGGPQLSDPAHTGPAGEPEEGPPRGHTPAPPTTAPGGAPSRG